MKISILTVMFVTLMLALPVQYSPPGSSAQVLAGINFGKAVPVDEAYRAEFDRCDTQDKFKTQRMTGFRKCSSDKNRVKALLKFPNGVIFFESKLSLDIDGSWKACNSAGATDQCPTWFKWRDQSGVAANVDADKYPYIAIPIAGLGGTNDREFREKTGVGKGDLGVVVFKDKVVPVFVADGGPHNKLGEGSTALLKAIGEDRCLQWHDGHCERVHDVSVQGGVLFFLFPNSTIPDLTPENALQKIKDEALRRFEELKAIH
jgi:Fungal chitosanase of glycosyl hydrolase group 75